MEKVSYAFEGEVPHMHTEREEKLVADSNMAQGKGNQDFFVFLKMRGTEKLELKIRWEWRLRRER